jgi:phosphate transport system permease protein
VNYDGMKKPRRILERITEAVFTVSGAVTTVTILLIVVFLFREGFGLFRSPAVERGYGLCVNAANPVSRLDPQQIKRIFDYQIVNWNEAGGADEPIEVFRIDDIFSIYSDEELGAENDYDLMNRRLGEVVAARAGIIAFVPEEYLPEGMDGVKILRGGHITPASFFGGREWIPTATPAPQFGVMPLILGTLWVSVVAILIALPLGLGVAIYLSELAGDRVRKVLKPMIELLAGIPSVVYGFFGLVVLVPLVQRAFNLPVGETGFTGAVILAIMALPTIITVAEDAMRATPRAMREASLALGATQWQTIRKVVVPCARSGISAAVVLGIGRAIGETMAVLMVTGNAAVMPRSLFEPLRTIPATIAAELGEAPADGAHYQALFMLGCILFVITLVISVTAEALSKQRRNYE